MKKTTIAFIYYIYVLIFFLISLVVPLYFRTALLDSLLPIIIYGYIRFALIVILAIFSIGLLFVRKPDSKANLVVPIAFFSVFIVTYVGGVLPGYTALIINGLLVLAMIGFSIYMLVILRSQSKQSHLL